MSDTTTAVYVRASTGEQNQDHQRHSIGDWLEEHDIEWSETKQYADTASGANDERPQFQELLSDIRDGQYDRVVTWEISRISRRGATLQEFFDACEEYNTAVIMTDGAVDRVDPDGTNRFVADIVGMVYQQERRQLIRRIESGIERAQREGKWLGQVPAGFARDDDGYLTPNLDADHSAGEVGYLELRDALKKIDDGASYRSIAKRLPVTRATLSTIDNDPERRAWYCDAEADDDRVAEALEPVET